MNPARAVLGSGLLALLAAPTAVGAMERPAVEMTVRMAEPDRALVEARIRPGPLARSAGFHGLTRGEDDGFRRQPMAFEREPDGGLAFLGEVAGGRDGWLRIPVPLPDSPPPAGTDLSFDAEITPPPGYRIVDAFPARAGPAQEDGAVRLRLPAPPSLLRFRVIAAEASGLGLPALVDGVLGVVLLALAVVGFARLRRPATASQ